MKPVPDLLAIVLQLEALRSGSLPATNGYSVRQGFLSMMSSLCATLPPSLGEKGEQQPYTLSMLRRGHALNGDSDPTGKDEKGSVINIQQGGGYWFRVTCLNRDLSRDLLLLLENPPRTFELARIPFRILGTPDAGHERCGRENYENLYARCFEDLQPPRTIGLKFLSATAFRMPSIAQGEKRKWNQLFPMPSTVYAGLLRRWNEWAPELLPAVSAQELEHVLMVSGYNLQTRILDYGSKGKQKGFIGYCEYEAKHDSDLSILKTIHLLTRFSFFAGLGYHTTWGMGQAKYVFP